MKRPPEPPRRPISRVLHMRVGSGDAKPSVTPVFQASAFEEDSAYFYTRKDNPNVAELESVIAELEGARYGVATTCGMAALRMCIDLLRPGDTVVINTLVYGCSFKLFQREAARLGLSLVVLDLTTQASLSQLPADTRMVFFETPTNPFLMTVPIREVTEAVRARRSDAIVVVDNTWATPIFQRPLAHGADLSVHSGTKYFGGHSDTMCGVILTDREDLHAHLRSGRFYSGAILDPHTAWLVRRSVQTLELRLTHQGRVTREIAEFVRSLPQIERVYYPDIDGAQLTGYGAIIFVDLRPDLADRYEHLKDSLVLFGTGTGMACVTSMIARPYTGSHASMNDGEKASIGLSTRTVRLCIGLEDPDDLRRDIEQAFSALDG